MKPVIISTCVLFFCIFTHPLGDYNVLRSQFSGISLLFCLFSTTWSLCRYRCHAVATLHFIPTLCLSLKSATFLTGLQFAKWCSINSNLPGMSVLSTCNLGIFRWISRLVRFTTINWILCEKHNCQGGPFGGHHLDLSDLVETSKHRNAIDDLLLAVCDVRLA